MLSLIARFWNGLKRPLTRDRFNYWIARAAGGTLECPHCGRKYRRSSAWILGGKVHLPGMEVDFVRPSFDSENRLVLECLECVAQAETKRAMAMEKRNPRPEPPRRIWNVVLGHTPPAHIDPLLAYMQSLAPDVPVILVYGGPQENFGKIQWEKKVFCADPNLRGPANDHHHIDLFNTIARFAGDSLADDDWVLYTEADCLPLRKDYAQEVVRLAGLAGADFAACNLHNQTCSNADWYQKAIQNKEWMDLMARNSRRKFPHQVFHCLGCLMLFRAGLLRRWLEFPHPKIPVYFETHIPTMAWHLGMELVNLYDFPTQFDFIRYRPPYDEGALPDALKNGALFMHPAKWGVERMPETLAAIAFAR